MAQRIALGLDYTWRNTGFSLAPRPGIEGFFSFMNSLNKCSLNLRLSEAECQDIYVPKTGSPKRRKARGPAPQREPMGLYLEAPSFDSQCQCGLNQKYRTSPFLWCRPPVPETGVTDRSDEDKDRILTVVIAVGCCWNPRWEYNKLKKSLAERIEAVLNS